MSEKINWWMFRFKIKQRDPVTVDFYVDSLLAYSIVAPVINEFSGSIPLWRFHRRAANDTNGHQFSFIFYSDVEVSQKIVSAIETRMENASYPIKDFIEQYSVDGPVGAAGDFAATSDPRWSSTLQQYWPEYSMGLSKLWLGLITGAVAKRGEPTENYGSYFKEVDKEITQIWQAEGQHALFHHTSALFGYKPLTIKRDIVF